MLVVSGEMGKLCVCTWGEGGREEGWGCTWNISHVAWDKPIVFWVDLHRTLNLCRWAVYLHWLVFQVLLSLCLIPVVL